MLSRRWGMLSSSTSFVPFMWMMDTRTSRVLEDVGGVGAGGGGGPTGAGSAARADGTGASMRMAGSPSAGTVDTALRVHRGATMPP